jgi:NhaA family Na+:H+ antiporter
MILGAFGLVNAGVSFSHVGVATVLVGAGLVVGKPLGITICVLLGQRFGLELPHGMRLRDVLVLGIAAGIGFTVALFVATDAFDPGATLAAAKMGALFSLVSALLAIPIAKLLRIQQQL